MPSLMMTLMLKTNGVRLAAVPLWRRVCEDATTLHLRECCCGGYVLVGSVHIRCGAGVGWRCV